MNDQALRSIEQDIIPLKEKLRNHDLYKAIKSIEDLKIFMSIHVYSVWDFMNLIKTLQSKLTCITVPWQPVDHTENARLLNEIILEEESDEIDGEYTSHFDYYMKAMSELMDISNIIQFKHDLCSGMDYKKLITQPYIPAPAQSFIGFTYKCIHESTLATAASFAFGRELLIPDLFTPLVSHTTLSKNPVIIRFIRFLERHIELDGDVHGELAKKMVMNLCKSEKDVTIIKIVAKQALESRCELWDEILKEIRS